MRNIYISIAAALPMMFGLVSCDDIDEKDRFIPIELEHSDKVVLIEEFTGAMCVYCPGGAAMIHTMLESEVYRDNLVAVSMYPSQQPSNTQPINVDLRTEAATEYFGAFKCSGLPNAMIDRTKFNGQYGQTTPTTWSGYVDQCLAESTPVSIDMSSEYDAATRGLNVSYDVTYVDPVIDEVYFQLWLVENGILSIQLSTTGPIIDYVNNHVLRAPINGVWGESLGAAHAANTKSAGSGQITLDPSWVAENVQIVGFVYRASDRKVLQAHLLKTIVDDEAGDDQSDSNVE